MMQTKTIAMLLVIAIATVGVVGIGTVTQSAQAQCPNHCVEVDPHGHSELPNHDQTGDSHTPNA